MLCTFYDPLQKFSDYTPWILPVLQASEINYFNRGAGSSHTPISFLADNIFTGSLHKTNFDHKHHFLGLRHSMTDAQMTVKPSRWLCSVFAIQQLRQFAFSALTLFVGRQEEHPVCKNWVVGCWRGHLSGVRCRLAYGLPDATTTHCFLLQWNPDWFYLSGTSSPG